MATDSTWTWTILMAKGHIFHSDQSITLFELLRRFEKAGYHETEIEAIIRH